MPARPSPSATAKPAVVKPPPPVSAEDVRAKVTLAAGLLEWGTKLYQGPPPTEGNEWKARGDLCPLDLPTEVAGPFHRSLNAASDYLADYFAERP